MHQLISLEHGARWDEACAQLATRDVFYRHAYARLCHDAGDGEPFLFVYRDAAGARVLYVFVRRPVPLAAAAGLSGRWYDLITPNRGYGGPLYGATDPDADARLLRGFRAELDAYCQEAGIVSEFVRFHPVLGNHRLLGQALDVTFDRETVLVPLDADDEALLARAHHNHRRNVRKAQSAGLTFRMLEGAQADALLEPFYGLYCATMDKVHAAPASYFSLAYVREIFSLFGPHALLGAAFLEGRLVSGAVYLHEGGLLHYHLGGSDQEWLRLGSNVFQFHHAACWGRAHGCHALHLGGGHVGRDALFEFKHRFAPGAVRDFYVGRKVHQAHVYGRLVEAWARQHGQLPPARYFPAYRAAPPAVPLPLAAAPAAPP